jgi:hypothetical protein
LVSSGFAPDLKTGVHWMRRIPKKALALLGLAAWAAWPLAAQTESASSPGAGLPERARWESLHRAVQTAAFTEAACGAKFAAQLQDTRNAAQAYLRAVAAGTVFWARQQEEALESAPELPPIAPALELIEAEAAEAERRLKELSPVRSLDSPVEALKSSLERSRFEWRSFPETATAAQAALAGLTVRNDTLRGMLKAQQGPLQAELQRLQAVYDLLETEVSRRCARSLEPAPGPEDPFSVPRTPAPRPPAARKK